MERIMKESAPRIIRSFPELFRKSRLATFDPLLPQVYKTYGPFKKRGDWGLKRTLPGVLRTDVVTVQALDTLEHQTPFESAQGHVRFTRKWKELFRFSKPPPPRSGKTELNISQMSDEEFHKFLAKVKKLKLESQKEDPKDLSKTDDSKDLSKTDDSKDLSEIDDSKDLSETDDSKDLSETDNSKDLSETDDSKDLQNIRSSKNIRDLTDLLGLLNATAKSQPSDIQGLTYSYDKPTNNTTVEGRILNKEAQGAYAVGVAGIVALLPFRRANRINVINREKLMTFYVEKAEFDQQGRPVVILSQSPILAKYDRLDFLNPTPRHSFLDSSTDRLNHSNKDVNQRLLERIDGLITIDDIFPETSNNAPAPKEGKPEDDFLSILSKTARRNS
ncbi:hypothetical protein G9A89_013506 [Geosiphon pyriformis]|nr:hypothetical protein G9A89_013506 [Geosiphon pyriformis]